MCVTSADKSSAVLMTRIVALNRDYLSAAVGEGGSIVLLHTILLVQVQKKKSPDVRLKKFLFQVILQVREQVLECPST